MKKTIEVIVLLILILIALTGCAQIKYEVEVKPDGSGEICYIYGISKDLLGNSVDDFIGEFKKQAEESNYQVETYEDDTITGFKASKHIEDLNIEFSLQEAFGEEYVKDTEENGIKIKKGLFLTKYSQTAELDLSTISENERSYVTMTYQVKLPAKAKSTNANETLDNNKILKWNLTAGEVNKIEFTAQSINILPIILISIAVVAIIVILIIIIFKKKHTTNNKK